GLRRDGIDPRYPRRAGPSWMPRRRRSRSGQSRVASCRALVPGRRAAGRVTRPELADADLPGLLVERELQLAADVEVERPEQRDGDAHLPDLRKGPGSVPALTVLCHRPRLATPLFLLVLAVLIFREEASSAAAAVATATVSDLVV